MFDKDSEERATTANPGRECARLERVSPAPSGEQAGASTDPDVPATFEASLCRFLPPGTTNERDLPDLEAYIRGTIRKGLPQVTEAHEIADFVAQGFLIAEEIHAKTPLGDSYHKALAAQLANRLLDYWREQHPEVRRNTRAARKAAERGEEYKPKVWAATGLAHEHGDVWSPQDQPRGDVTDEVYERLKIDELAGITSARELMVDRQKAGLLFGVGSYYLPTARAEWAFEWLQELRLEHRLDTRFNSERDPL
jgi:hypothetical protein